MSVDAWVAFDQAQPTQAISRARVEELARNYGKLTAAETARMINRCVAAVEEEVTLAERLCKEIPGFGDLGARLVELWRERTAAFAA